MSGTTSPGKPTQEPTLNPTTSPTQDPTWDPTQDPTREPAQASNQASTWDPTAAPSDRPTTAPTKATRISKTIVGRAPHDHPAARRRPASIAIERRARSHRPAHRRPAAKTIWGESAVLGIKIEKESNIKGQRTTSPRAVIPPPARKGSNAIPPRVDPRWLILRAQTKKKEESALEIKIEGKLFS